MPRDGPLNASIYIRSIPPDTKGDELKEIFGKYGPVSDVYIPLDYHSREPRGFAYVQFEDPRDADDAIYYMKGFEYRGTELRLEFARSERKTPQMMRSRERGPRFDGDEEDMSYGYKRRRSYSRSPRRRSYDRSLSPSPRRHASPRKARREEGFEGDFRKRRGR